MTLGSSTKSPPAPLPTGSPADTNLLASWSELDGLTRAAVVCGALSVAAMAVPLFIFLFAPLTIGFALAAISKARRTARPNRIAKVCLTVAAVELVLVGAGTALLAAGSTTEAFDGQVISAPASAPAADTYVRVSSVDKAGTGEVEIVLRQLNDNALEGTPRHRITAVSEVGITSVYSYQAPAVGGGTETMSCVGEIDEVTGATGSSCGFDIANAPNLTWGATLDSDGHNQNATVWYTPEGAVWLRVETTTGTVVVANVSDGIGYAEWSESQGNPRRVSILDADHNEIWLNTVN